MRQTDNTARQEEMTPPQEICRGALCIAEVLSDVDAWTLTANHFDSHKKQWIVTREKPYLLLNIIHQLDEDAWRLKAGWVEEAFWMTEEESQYIFDAAAPLIKKCQTEFAELKQED
jgi:hypothetical protein